MFQKRYISIVEHNERFKHDEETYEMEMYYGMHVQWRELAEGKLGFAPGAGGRTVLGLVQQIDTNIDLPDSIDSRENCENPILNQGVCGSCFTFSACGM